MIPDSRISVLTDFGKPIAGVILAAGMATRMGHVKQLLEFRGKPLLAKVFENARAAGCLSPLIVVLGHQASEIRQQIDFSGGCVVVAEDYALGQSASLKAGLSMVPTDCIGVLFLLGDQPLITAGVITKVMAAFCRSGADIVIPTYGGKRGNPVLIGRKLFSHLSSLTGDAGARTLFQAYPERITEVEVGDEGDCFDVDTWEDYRTLCRL